MRKHGKRNSLKRRIRKFIYNCRVSWSWISGKEKLLNVRVKLVQKSSDTSLRTHTVKIHLMQLYIEKDERLTFHRGQRIDIALMRR